MTDSIKFISYELTPSIEKQKGIATVLLDDKYIARVKIVEKKDGGTFMAFANLQGEPDGQTKTWVNGFECDRNSDKEKLFSFIRQEINKSQSNGSSFQESSAGTYRGASQAMDDGCPF